MKLIFKHLFVAFAIIITPFFGYSQCNTTISFDTWLSGGQSTSQNMVLSGTLTQVQFNLNFYASGGEWPADMIVVITAPNGNCMAGEGYNIYPPSSCYDIDFPSYWVTTANGFYTYTMSALDAGLSGDGTWLFDLQNGWTSSSNAHYDLDIILWGVCGTNLCETGVLCGEGTYWDTELSQCVIPDPSDSNFDGCVDLNDLMDLLSNYGICIEPEFTCGDDIEHEGYSYSTVQIGDQCWFSENCRYLPEVSPFSASSTTDPYYYVYDYQGTDVAAAQATTNYETYGVLYNWPAVMIEGICPSGWHIPTDGEFTQLTDFLGGTSVAGGKMKEAGYDHWAPPNTGATNSSGFTGLPGGFCYYDGFGSVGSYGYWWSSSESGSDSWLRRLLYSNVNIHQSNFDRYYGFSARCVRD